MAPPTMKLANRSKVYTSVSIVFDNRENCKQCQPNWSGLVSTGVYYFLISAQKHRCGSTTIYVLSRNMKISEVLSENVHFLVVKISIYLYRRVFVMESCFLPDVLDTRRSKFANV